MIKLSFGEIVYKSKESNYMAVLERGDEIKILMDNIPFEIRWNLFSDDTLEEKCKMIRGFLEVSKKNKKYDEWNDKVDFNEILFFHKWVEIKYEDQKI